MAIIVIEQQTLTTVCPYTTILLRLTQLDTNRKNFKSECFLQTEDSSTMSPI